MNAQKVEQARRVAAAAAKRHGMIMAAQRNAAAARNRAVAARRRYKPAGRGQKKDENEGESKNDLFVLSRPRWICGYASAHISLDPEPPYSLLWS